jgi:predicted HicB family RNase H-like nuclease
MVEYKRYFGAVEAEDGTFQGCVAGLRDVVTFEGATFAEVEQAFRGSIDDEMITRRLLILVSGRPSAAVP